MRLSAALIVRDEADHLRRCLASLADVVDEIVVVDTGSTDDSVAVARSFGALVLHRPWDGSFAAPRNLGLDHVTGDWVLYIDADEHMRPVSRAHVEAQLADPDGDVLGLRVRLRTHRTFTPIREYRLWRHRPDVRFAGAIHETHVAALYRIAEAEALRIADADLQIDHEGYEGDLTHKHRRNLPLLERQLLDAPDRVYLWSELGRAKIGLDDFDGGLDAFREGVARVRANGVRSTVDCIAHTDLIMALAEDGQPDPALVAEADALFPRNALVDWAALLDAAARGDHEVVIERATRLLAWDAEEVAASSLGIDERALGHWSLHARGMALFQLGRLVEARDDFAAAEAAAPGVPDYGVKRRLADARLAASGR